MSAPTIPGWPGTGPVPDPEPEGLRDKLIEDQAKADEAKAADAQKRSAEAAAFYSGADTKPTTTTKSSKGSSSS